MISVKIKNKKLIDQVSSGLDREAKAVNVKLTKKVLLLTNLIKTGLNEAIGEKARHFDVKVEMMTGGVKIVVTPNSKIGSYIYSGTSAHDIVSSYQPMPMPDGGFSRSVRHPGTDPMKPKIDQAITKAIIAARLMS